MKNWLSSHNIDFRRNRTRIIVMCCVFLALLVYAYVIHFSAVKPASEKHNSNIDTVLEVNQWSVDLLPSTEVTQTFIAKEDITGFSLLFGIMDHNLQGKLQVDLVDADSDRIVSRHEVDLNELIYDEAGKDLNYEFILEEPEVDAAGKEYRLIISTAGQQSEYDAIALVTSEGDSYTDGESTINGELAAGDISFRVFESENSFIVPLYWAFVAFLAVAFVVTAFILLKNQFKIEHLFLISVLCIGTIYIFIMTPLSIPDEPAHFDTAYQYSNTFLFKGPELEDSHILMRSDDAEFLEEFGICPNIKEYHYLAHNILDRVDDNSLIPVKAQLVKTTPYVYFPAAIGITIGRLLGAGSAAVFYMGRFANLIAFALAGFLSIRKIPFGKMVFFVVALLPMTMQQVSSYSYDAVVYGLAFLFISYCLHAAYDKEELKRRDIIILSALGVFLAPAKAVYVCICLLVFVIPRERFAPLKMRGNKKAKSISVVLGSSVLSFMAFNIVSIISTYLKTDTSVLSYGVEPGYTVSYLLSHLGRLFLIIRRTLLYESSYFLESMLGKYLGWLNMEVSSLLMYSFFALLILSAIKEDREKIHLTSKNKVLIVFIVGSVFALVCAAMLLSFTPMTAGEIVGVQGRYFLPVLPLALFFFRNDRIVVKKNMSQLMIFAVWTLQLLTLAYVFQWVLFQMYTP